jgi:hypothetical protein
MKHIGFTFVIAVALQVSPAAQQPPATSCQVSETVYRQSPPEPGADPVIGDWYMNDKGTIRVAVPRGGWNAGGRVYRGNEAIKGRKTYWVRPRGTTLEITGVRLDGPAPAVEADVPCCYTSGFQIVALHFPTEGCWEVRATSGDDSLSFVTRVLPPLPSRPPQRRQ